MTRRRAAAARGFTLIELLVVVVIIGVLALALTIAVGSAGGERRLAREAESFAARVGYACNRAEITGREIGIAVELGGYSYTTLSFDGWSALPESDELRERRFVEGLRVELARERDRITLADKAPAQPQIVCYSSGELTPFALTLALGEVPTRYRVAGEPDGQIKVTRVEASR